MRQVVEELAGSVKVFIAFLFGTKFGRVGDEAAAGAARGMLHMQHLVVQDILYNELWNARAIHATVQYDLIGAGIVATELAAPPSAAPGNMRTRELARKIPFVDAIEQLGQIVVRAFGRSGCGTHTMAAEAVNARSRTVRTRVCEIRLDQRAGRAAAIDARKKQRRGSFENGYGRATKKVGEADIDDIAAAPQRDHQAAVRVENNVELRRAAFATDAGEHTLKQGNTAGNVSGKGCARGQRSALNSCAGPEAERLSSWRLAPRESRLRCLRQRRRYCPCNYPGPGRWPEISSESPE